MTEKVEVNGDERHPLYAELVTTPDEKGKDGDITWNFEKFLVDGDGRVVARFSPGVEPDDAADRPGDRGAGRLSRSYDSGSKVTSSGGGARRRAE